MAIQISISNAIGSRYRGSVVPPIDPDAQAFITAASITDPTQQAAINTLVVDLKGYSIWTKMKAIYPYVGGSAASHSYNLKNTSQFQITWSGGVTHSANGVLFGGVNGYGNTNYNISVNNTGSNISAGVYSRTNAITSGVSIGAIEGTFIGLQLAIKFTDNNTYYAVNDFVGNGAGNFVSDTRGMFVVSRTSGVNTKVVYRNGISLGTQGGTSNTAVNLNVYVGARNYTGVANSYDSRQQAFAFLADTLTATDVTNLTTAVQAFQTTLGRSIGTQTVSDADAQAFVTNAGIVDQVEANAINNLVIGLKADGLWTKMKALYPFVGGTSTTNKFNLKNPLDTDAAFRLVFNGGWTHSSNGATPNGTNGYANTFVNTLNNLGANSAHLAYYSRTNSAVGNEIPMGNLNASSGASGLNLVIRRTSDVNSFRATDASTNGIVSSTVTDSIGLFIGSITSTTSRKTYKNSSVLNTLTTNYTWDRANYNLYLAAANDILTTNAFSYTNKECAFASIGDGLTDTEAANLYTAVQAFQTTLGRQV